MRAVAVCLFALFLLPASAEAQRLGRLVDRARAAVAETVAETVAPERAAEARTGTPPPAPVYGTLLSAVRLNEQVGVGTYLDLLPVQFVFLSEREGTADLFRDGERVAGFTWETYDSVGPFFDVEPPQMTWPDSDFNALGYVFESGGAYELVYSEGGAPFWRFPFTVAASGGDDPYAPSTSYRLGGAWETDAYILHDDRESGEWTFKLWLHPADLSTDQNAYLRVTRDGESEPVLIGGSRQARIGFIDGGWGRKEYELVRPGQQNRDGGYFDNRPFRANTERLDDGAYTLTFFLGDAPYGRYPFTVAGGEIVPTGQQAAGADAETRIDGGGEAVWLVRE